MVHSIGEPDINQSLFGSFLSFVRCNTCVDKGKLDIMDCVRSCQKIKCLEYKPDLFIPDLSQLIIIHLANTDAVKIIFTGSRSIQATKDVHESRFTRSRWAHYG